MAKKKQERAQSRCLPVRPQKRSLEEAVNISSTESRKSEGLWASTTEEGRLEKGRGKKNPQQVY